MKSLKQFWELREGLYDPGIFKAIFLAGGPGSGKSYVVKRTTGGLGLKVVNSDDVYEKMLSDVGLDTTPEDIYSDLGQETRVKAKGVTKRMQGNYLAGRLGIIIDGTGKDYDKITAQADKLKKLGYDVSMIFVDTSLDTAQEQNRKRKRTLPDSDVEKMWNDVQKNKDRFAAYFGSDYIRVENNMAGEDVFAKVWKRVRAMVSKKVSNPIAKAWMSAELQKKKSSSSASATPISIQQSKSSGRRVSDRMSSGSTSVRVRKN